jgi:predicted nucleotide-binding protein
MSNAGYAFIVATPDDLGSYRKDIEKSKEELLINPETINVKSILTILSKFKTRARQNVVFEHGLFIGALGRDRVCCLLQADTQDKQTDIDGIVYVCFKENVSETFPEIVEKLKDPKIGLIKP